MDGERRTVDGGRLTVDGVRWTVITGSRHLLFRFMSTMLIGDRWWPMVRLVVLVCRSDSIDTVYNDYTDIIKWHLNATVPICNVSMRERDHATRYTLHVTPRIKLLLRKRNKLTRAGKIEHADCISVKINRLIAKNRSTALADADTKQLWAMLKKTGNWGAQKQTVTNLHPD